MGFPAEQFLLDLVLPEDLWDSPVDPQRLKEAVLSTLQKIAASDSGMALLQSVQLQGGWIMVIPSHDCNSHGAGIRQIRHKRLYNGILLFDPFSYMSGSACYVRKRRRTATRGFLPDEVMFHELIHAHRGALRLSLNSPDRAFLGGGLKWYGHEEEFLAIVLTNIHIYDVTNPHSSGLRADWYGGRPLEKALSNSLSFFEGSTQILPLLKKFQKEQQFLFNKLAAVKAKFNPLAAMVQHPHEVEKLSHSKFAVQRERMVPKLHIEPTRDHFPTPKEFDTVVQELAKEALQVLQ